MSATPPLSAEQPTSHAPPAPAPRRPRWPWLVLPLAAGAAGAALFGHFFTAEQRDAPAPAISADAHGVTLPAGAPQWRYVQLETAAAQPALAPLPAPGRVTFDERRTAAVGTPLAGRVEAVLVRTGDRVKQGERLFSVRSAALADLDREEQGAQEEVSAKKRVVERTRELVGINAAPEKDLIAAETELKQAELALKAAQAKRASLRVSSAGENLFWVTAPRTGTVVESALFANQEVSPERAEPLVRISDLDEVLVLADVQEVDARDLKEGEPVTVRAPGASGDGLPGTVDHVSDVVDPERRAVEVRIRVPNAQRTLRPNAFVEVAFPPEASTPRVRVPAEAVVTDGSRAVAFVAREGGRLERVRVTPGRQRDGEVEVLEGLAPGTRYVARGALLLENQIELAE